MVPSPGFEPGLKLQKSLVHPLHHEGIQCVWSVTIRLSPLSQSGGSTIFPSYTMLRRAEVSIPIPRREPLAQQAVTAPSRFTLLYSTPDEIRTHKSLVFETSSCTSLHKPQEHCTSNGIRTHKNSDFKSVSCADLHKSQRHMYLRWDSNPQKLGF